jgi:hypothetical protein
MLADVEAKRCFRCEKCLALKALPGVLFWAVLLIWAREVGRPVMRLLMCTDITRCDTPFVTLPTWIELYIPTPAIVHTHVSWVVEAFTTDPT